MHRLVRNLFRCRNLDPIEILARQLQPQHGKRSHRRHFVLQEPIKLHPIMNIKVAIARWLSLRIQEQTRIERRALRDYSRQELGRMRRADIRSRGLRLYAAWSQPGVARFKQPVPAEWPTPFERAA
jgi:hypothetical protein